MIDDDTNQKPATEWARLRAEFSDLTRHSRMVRVWQALAKIHETAGAVRVPSFSDLGEEKAA